MTERVVVILAYPGVQSLDVTGPLEVFTGAGQSRPGAYRILIAAPDRGAVTTESGLRLLPDCAVSDLPTAIDTLIVPGGWSAMRPDKHRELIGWLPGAAASARRIASVCGGAFLLAEAGLLAGRRATTHWYACPDLAERYPDVTVEAAPIYVRDGDVWTSAGVTAGIDLALALVEDDLGHEVALTVARWLVVFLRRPGNQAQFSTQLAAQTADHEPVRAVQHWIAANPGADCAVDELARRARMSPRHFARTFTAQVGMAPGQYVTSIRLEAARRRLEESDTALATVASTCGLGSAETLRRTFQHALGMSPAEYRRRFRSH
jgi:transcriptional regulator GlxA family with amidase domain